MSPLLNNLHHALPEIIILLTICAALLCELFLTSRYPRIVLAVSLFGFVLAFLAHLFLLGQERTILFSGLFVDDDLAQIMKIFVTIIAFLSFFYSYTYLQERHMPQGDYYVLALCSILGMMVLISAHSLLTIYLGLELLSLPLYALTGIRRMDSNATEAALKYFVMGAIASGMLLYGMSMLYGVTGHLELDKLSAVLTQSAGEHPLIFSFALVFIMVGIGFKLAAVPFHMWAPDVYEGAPTSVTLFLSTAPKIAAMAMAFRLLVFGLSDLMFQWQQLLLVFALLSAGFGNLFAVVQTNLKRLLAYSAIGQIGFALFGLLSGQVGGYGAALYYIVVYALTAAAGFGLLVILSQKGVEIESLDDLKGLNRKSPWLAFMMLIVLFSMAGIPPTVGFFIKLMVLKALVDAQLIAVAVLGVLFSVIGAYYYLRVVKVMYFDEEKETLFFQPALSLRVVFSINCLALLYLGIFPSGLIALCLQAFS